VELGDLEASGILEEPVSLNLMADQQNTIDRTLQYSSSSSDISSLTFSEEGPLDGSISSDQESQVIILPEFQYSINSNMLRISRTRAPNPPIPVDAEVPFHAINQDLVLVHQNLGLLQFYNRVRPVFDYICKMTALQAFNALLFFLLAFALQDDMEKNGLLLMIYAWCALGAFISGSIAYIVI
jgi:hypothetical protein